MDPSTGCLFPGHWCHGYPVACSAPWTSGLHPRGPAKRRSPWACWSWWRISSMAPTATFWSATLPRRTLATPNVTSCAWLTPRRWFLSTSWGARCGHWSARLTTTVCTGRTAGRRATCQRNGAGRNCFSQTWRRLAAPWRTISCVGRRQSWGRSWRGSCTLAWLWKAALDRWTWSTRLSSTT